MKTLIFCLFSFLLFKSDTVAQEFKTDFDESIQLAQETDKTILMVFSGSDWCKPCIQLQNQILSTDEFIEYSENNLVLLKLDFPYKKKNQLPKDQLEHNEKLADKYNEEGSFPKMILLDSSEDVLASIQYKKNMQPEELIHELSSILKQ